MELAAGFNDAVDACLPNNCGRTDLGEMAQMAGVETLVGQLGARTQGFFDTTTADVRRELAALHTVKHLGIFMRAFFARLTYRTLDYFLSRVLSLHVGEGRRLTTLERQAEFSDALETHCSEAAVVV